MIDQAQRFKKMPFSFYLFSLHPSSLDEPLHIILPKLLDDIIICLMTLQGLE